MEAAPGFEPGNKGFAVLCLTTWLCRHRGVLQLRVKIISDCRSENPHQYAGPALLVLMCSRNILSLAARRVSGTPRAMSPYRYMVLALSSGCGSAVVLSQRRQAAFRETFNAS